MKKEKSSSKQSKKQEGLKVLVPLISKREADPAFIETVASGAREIILLLVIDTAAMSGQFGFAAGEISHANALMQEVKGAVGKKRKTCDDVIEWGDTLTKVEHFALLRNVDKLFLVEQDNQFFKKLLNDLKEKLPKVKIETIRLAEETE